MMRSSNPMRLKEVWIIMFLLGNIMINFPFIHIFNKEITVFGYPLLFLYFMLGWPLSILVVFLFSSKMEDEATDEDEEDQGKGGS